MLPPLLLERSARPSEYDTTRSATDEPVLAAVVIERQRQRLVLELAPPQVSTLAAAVGYPSYGDDGPLAGMGSDQLPLPRALVATPSVDR